MKKIAVLFTTLAILLLGVGVVNACQAEKEGYVYCDVNQNGEIDPGDTRLEGVKVYIQNESGTWGPRYDITDENGYFHFWLRSELDTYVETLDETTLPDDFWYVDPSDGVHVFTTTDDQRYYYNEWLIDSNTCREGLCWLTGGGVKFEPMIDEYMAEHGPRDSLGGNVYPGCNPDSGEGGQWNHIAHKLKLHFQGWTIQVVECGNVPGIEPGSESPETPYNYIEFMGTGTLKGIHGNKMPTKDVAFYARCEDRNEPGSNGAKDGEDIDRYFLHVFDPSSGETLLLIDEDNDPTEMDPMTISGGNLQIHISGCDDPPM